jgi:hypothetical protein
MNTEFITKLPKLLVLYKKKIVGIIILGVLVFAFSVGAHAMFRVKGVVTGIDEHSITIANFLRTQTVDLTGSPVSTSNIKPGDRVKIKKNLQGTVLSVEVNNHHHGEEYDEYQ